MAFVPKNPDQEEAFGLTSVSGNTIPQSGSQGGGDVSPNTPAPQAPVNKGGSQFSDVTTYLNQNRPQAQRLASKVGTNVVNAGSQVRNLADQQTQNLKAAQNTFNQNVEAARQIYDPSKSAAAINARLQPRAPLQRDPGRGGGDGSSLRGARSARAAAPAPVQPAQPAIDPAIDAAFNAMRNAQYAGPMAFNYAPDNTALNTAAQKANALGENTKTYEGRQDLLRGIPGAPQAGAANNLDAILLGSAPAQNVLMGAAGQNADINGRLEALKALEGDVASQTGEKVSAAKKEAGETAASANKAISDAVSGAQKTYDDRKAQAMGSTGRTRRSLRDMLPEDLQKIEALKALMGA